MESEPLVSPNEQPRENRGFLRPLTSFEKKLCPRSVGCCLSCRLVRCRTCGRGGYNYVTTEPYTLQWRQKTLTIPAGFLTDGSTYGPDLGTSWLYHDYLYATHKFSSGEACSRAEADQVMIDILKNDRMFVYAKVVNGLTSTNPFWLFSSYWKKSHARGAEYLADQIHKLL